MPHPPHFAWLSDTGQHINAACGTIIEVWQLNATNDAAILSDWARRFRQHYCSDHILPNMVAGSGLNTSSFLLEKIFPHHANPPGPSVRAGDFAEILVTDFLEFSLGCWCPARDFRYAGRWNANDATKGCDVVGFKFSNPNGAAHPGDKLYVFEVKAGMSPANDNKLQKAIDDSVKDAVREAYTLNAIKHHFLTAGRADDAAKVTRFQMEADRPFQRINGAAAVVDTAVANATNFLASDSSQHPGTPNLKLLVVKGDTLMALVHALYERAAHEA